MMKNAIGVNNKYKDRLFCLIFGSEKYKRHLLKLFNALNHTDYTDEDVVEITTIEDAIYMKMKNDVSCIINSLMSLFEQQSTYNPNMPFREFEYCAKLYSKYIEVNNLDIYGRSLVKIPAPRCYVLYNGTSERPDIEIARLSDAFMVPGEGYEWTTYMLNINKEHNAELLEECKILGRYSDFVASVRENMNLPIAKEAAVDKTIQEFIKSQDDFSEILLECRSEVIEMCITEYNEVRHEENVRAEGYLEGQTEGENKLATLISLMLRDGLNEMIGKVASDPVMRAEMYKKYHL